MKKLLTIYSFAIAAVAASCAPAYCQQLTLEQMMRMTGGNQAHLSSLQTQYDTRGLQVNVAGRGGYPNVQYGYAPASAGDSGDFGNQPSGSYTLANDANTVSEYYGQTADQRTYSRGGLPETNTAVQSLDGGFGKRFGRTQIPSRSFTYGFGNYKEKPYRGVSGNRAVRGRNLPPVSTASVDINIVDR